MSHLTRVNTSFRELIYLKKVLKENILNELNVGPMKSTDSSNLVIPQSNGYDIKFVWNGEVYELMTDKSFWEQPYSLNTFMNKLSRHYAEEAIIEKTHQIGFQIDSGSKTQNTDGSTILVLNRWIEDKNKKEVVLW